MSDPQIGCGDNSCVFSVIRPRGGMGTNGGCRCFKNLVGHLALTDGSTRSNREEVRQVERSTRMLAQEVRRLREEAKYHDEANALRKLRERELDKARAENTKLRVILAKSNLPCLYCVLPSNRLHECKSGFASCGRLDDLMEEDAP